MVGIGSKPPRVDEPNWSNDCDALSQTIQALVRYDWWDRRYRESRKISYSTLQVHPIQLLFTDGVIIVGRTKRPLGQSSFELIGFSLWEG